MNRMISLGRVSEATKGARIDGTTNDPGNPFCTTPDGVKHQLTSNGAVRPSNCV